MLIGDEIRRTKWYNTKIKRHTIKYKRISRKEIGLLLLKRIRNLRAENSFSENTKIFMSRL